MVTKNYEDERGFVFVDEQIVSNHRYSVSTCYAPSVGITSVQTKISYSTIDDSKNGCDYEEVHSIDFVDGNIRCMVQKDDRIRSTGPIFYTEDPMQYYDEIMSAFDNLVASGLSEFSDKALEIINRVKETVKNKHSSK